MRRSATKSTGPPSLRYIPLIPHIPTLSVSKVQQEIQTDDGSSITLLVGYHLVAPDHVGIGRPGLLYRRDEQDAGCPASFPSRLNDTTPIP